MIPKLVFSKKCFFKSYEKLVCTCTYDTHTCSVCEFICLSFWLSCCITNSPNNGSKQQPFGWRLAGRIFWSSETQDKDTEEYSFGRWAAVAGPRWLYPMLGAWLGNDDWKAGLNWDSRWEHLLMASLAWQSQGSWTFNMVAGSTPRASIPRELSPCLGNHKELLTSYSVWLEQSAVLFQIQGQGAETLQPCW